MARNTSTTSGAQVAGDFVPVPGRAVRRNPVAAHPPGWAPAPLRQHVIQAVSRSVDGTRRPGRDQASGRRTGPVRGSVPGPVSKPPQNVHTGWPGRSPGVTCGWAACRSTSRARDSSWNPWLWPLRWRPCPMLPTTCWPGPGLSSWRTTAVLEQFIGPGMIDACTVLLKEAFCNRGPVLDFDAEVRGTLGSADSSGRGRSCRALSTKLRRRANKRTGRFGPTGTAQSGQPRCRIAVGSFLAPSPTW